MKNRMKSILMVMTAAVLMLLVTVDANAQRYGRRGGPGGPGGPGSPGFGPDSSSVDRMVDRMSEDLDLTDKQAAEIREIHYAHIAEAQNHRQEMREIARKHREEMDETREEMDEEIMDVLTNEQKEEFENFRPGRGQGYYGKASPRFDNRGGRGYGRRGQGCVYWR
jgi:Spy/CpxP family protein refolding chaperone